MKSQGRVVYFNGEFVPESEARISIYDSALMFGDMVFEMMRSFNKKHFKLREHLERLYASTRFVRIPVKMTIDEMEKAFYETIEANAHTFGEKDEIRSLINVSRGPLYIYRRIFAGKMEPTIIIACFPLKWVIGHMAHFYETGVHAVIPSQRAIPAPLLEPKVKNRSRLFYQIANIEAALVDKDAWALLLDPDGFIAEGTGSNFFLVKDGKLFTPEPRNILRGISRKYVMELAAELGIECFERNLEVYDAYDADEAFFTCTPFSIMSATKINGLTIGTGKPGVITTKLLSLWSEKVGVDILKQAREYGEEVAREEQLAVSSRFTVTTK